jgi:hypothetical protein
MVIFLSIYNLETRCSNSAASLVQWWVRRYCSSSVAFFEDQNAGFDCMFGAIGLAALSDLGRSKTQNWDCPADLFTNQTV